MLNKTVTNANPSGTQLDTSLPTQYIATHHYPLLMVCQPLSVFEIVYHIPALQSLSTEQDFSIEIASNIIFCCFVPPIIKSTLRKLFIWCLSHWSPLFLIAIFSYFFWNLILHPYCLLFLLSMLSFYIVCQCPTNICQASLFWKPERKYV